MRFSLIALCWFAFAPPVQADDAEEPKSSEPPVVADLDGRVEKLKKELEALLAERSRAAAAREEEAFRKRIETLFKEAEKAAEAGERDKAEALRREALTVQEERLRALYAASGARDSDEEEQPGPGSEEDWERHYWDEQGGAPGRNLRDVEPDERQEEVQSEEAASPERAVVDETRRRRGQKKATKKRTKKRGGGRRRARRRAPDAQPEHHDRVVRDRVDTVEAILHILRRPLGAPTPRSGPSPEELAELRRALHQIRTQLHQIERRLDTYTSP